MRIVVIHGLLLLFAAPLARSESSTLQWRKLKNNTAVCNDFSRAGYFFNNESEPSKWIVYLESGGLCYSGETCNKRYIHPAVRKEFADSSSPSSGLLFPDFNVTEAWLQTKDYSFTDRINPYMSSLSNFLGQTYVTGRDILDGNCTINPFCNYNKILIPYCSSDVWLGNDQRNFSYLLDQKDPQGAFMAAFDPTNSSLQFTFRGQVIFQSVISELLQNLSSGIEDLVLAGSSAGGLGVINNAQWVIDQVPNEANVSIITDSSWFINFRDGIYRRFNGTLHGSDTEGPTDKENDEAETLLSIISASPQCSDVSSGSPCCLSLSCMLAADQYFPVGEIPVLTFFSLYDIYLLADSLASIPLFGINTTQPNVTTGTGIDFLTITSEYVGAMNTSVKTIAPVAGSLSYATTHCFQHIYLATSSLWDENGIFKIGSTEELGENLGSFGATLTHRIQSGTWISYSFVETDVDSSAMDLEQLSSCDPNQARNLRDAVAMWKNCRHVTQLVFTDNCDSLNCTQQCPDMVNFILIRDSPVPDWAKYAISAVVIAITCLSFCMKIVFAGWKHLLLYKQELYLTREGNEIDGPSGNTEFPVCGIDDALSVACRDLSYCVEYNPSISRKKVKDERDDKSQIQLVIGEDTNLDGDDSEKSNLKRSCSERGPLRSGHSRSMLHHIASVRRPRLKSMPNRPKPFKSASSFANHSLKPISELPEESLHNENNEMTAFSSKNLEDSYSREKWTNSSNYGDSLSKETVELMKRSPPPLSETLLSRTFSGHPNTLKALSHEPADSEPIEPQSRFRCCRVKKKTILKRISLYFNPGELVGIMGPSGSGKTTFLDMLTGRRKAGTMTGDIFVNGVPLEGKVRQQYIEQTGYVLQLATPYYEELTVRENVTLAAHMKLHNGMTWREKFERVEQVLSICGLSDLADIKVGGLTGPGLSGGQKRRLTVALQLLKMPRVIFLDEPTSGLDATSSIELLHHLNKLAYSNRTVVLTIHQPRFEIFYMFHKLVLLSDGQVAYHGVPKKAYAVFVQALRSHFITRGMVMPLEDQNPADVIMDMLGVPKLRKVILDYYVNSEEPGLVRKAINLARYKSLDALDEDDLPSDAMTLRKRSQTRNYAWMSTTISDEYGRVRTISRQASTFNRLAVLEMRATLRNTWVWRLYLPVIFFSYGLLLGTVYLQTEKPVLVISGFCVYSVASALFMFPVLQNYYLKSLEVRCYEHADGAGKSFDLVIQGFGRYATIALIPVTLCATVVYVLIINQRLYDWYVFAQLLVVNMALNQTWIALLIFVLCTAPHYAFRLSPIISSVAGFTSGFFIPRDDIGLWYRWLFYINPNYYGFSASANLLLKDFSTNCTGHSEVDCFLDSGLFTLAQFDFDDIDPYLHIIVLLLMTLIFLLLAVFSNWAHHTTFFDELWKTLFKKSEDINVEELLEDTKQWRVASADFQSVCSSDEGEDDDIASEREGGASPYIDDVFSPTETPRDLSSSLPATPEPIPSQQANESVRMRWKRGAALAYEQSIEEEDEEMEAVLLSEEQPVNFERGMPSRHSKGKKAGQQDKPEMKKRKRDRHRLKSLYLGDGEQHRVFQPGQHSRINSSSAQFSNNVENTTEQPQHRMRPSRSQVPTTPVSPHSQSLKERRDDFHTVVKATQVVLKEQTVEMIQSDELDPKRPKHSLKTISQRVRDEVAKNKQVESPNMYKIVELAMKEKHTLGSSTSEDSGGPAEGNGASARVPSTSASPHKVHWPKSTSAVFNPNLVPVPIKTWKKLVQKKSSRPRGMTQSASHSTLQVSAANKASNRPKSAHFDSSEPFVYGGDLHKPSSGGASPYSLECIGPAKLQNSPAQKRDISRSNPGLVTPSIRIATVGSDSPRPFPRQLPTPSKDHDVAHLGGDKTKSWMCSAPSLHVNYQ